MPGAYSVDQEVGFCLRPSLRHTPDAIKLVAKKLQSHLAVEGELPGAASASYGGGDNMMMTLARKIVSGQDDDYVKGMNLGAKWGTFMFLLAL